MKKTYTEPASLSVRLRTEGMMAASLVVGGETTEGGEEIIETEGGVLSKENGSFDSGIWGNAGE